MPRDSKPPAGFRRLPSADGLGQHIVFEPEEAMKTTPSSTRQDETAQAIAHRLADEGAANVWMHGKAVAIINAELAPLYEQKEELVRVLRSLVEKLKLILPKVDAMCVMEHIHGRPYTGPTITEELREAEAALEKAGGGK